MNRIQMLNAVIILSLLSTLATRAADEPEWMSPTIGPLSPSAHFNGAIGDSSGDPEELATGHHDPTREDGTVQGIELGLSLRLEQIEGFAVYNIHYGAEEEWAEEWEEAFLKVRDLPGGFEARGGRILGRYGQQNARHLHAWRFVDTPIVLGRFLGEDGLRYDGGDVTWLKQDVETTFGITVGYGEAKAHAHGHEHEDEEQADHDEEEEEHDHAEEIAFADDVASGRFFTQFRRDDFRLYEGGFSLAVGDEEAGRQVVVYGLDFSYNWREKGLEPDGRAFVWATELLYRDVESGGSSDVHEEDADHLEEGEEHDHEHHEKLPGGAEYGLYSEIVYTLNQKVDLGTRIGYVEGNDKLGTDERFQVSPAVTTYLDPYRRTSLKFQYNYDDLEVGSEEHSVWVQLGLHWGGAEVR